MGGEKGSHFKGKNPMQHIAEVQAEGIMASSEIHGAETPGSIFAACDSAKEVALVSLLLATELLIFGVGELSVLVYILILTLGMSFWKIGRSAHLAWSRLERLHRVAREEKHEIETNRGEEREELKALYEAKGLRGKLLEDVIDVLMADGDRLLRVMLEEEMGFRLEENEHPLVQAAGAGIGACIGGLIPAICFYFFGGMGLVMGALFAIAIASFISAEFQRNRTIPAVVWSVAVALFAYVVVLTCSRFLVGNI